jgi:hypothetical protein
MNNVISLEEAIAMTTLFRKQLENLLNPVFSGKNILPICETFDRDVFDKILSQTGCVKLRIYSGLSPDLMRKSIIVGVNEKDEDMLPSSEVLSATDGDDGYLIGEEGQTCPPYCPPRSPINP